MNSGLDLTRRGDLRVAFIIGAVLVLFGIVNIIYSILVLSLFVHPSTVTVPKTAELRHREVYLGRYKVHTV